MALLAVFFQPLGLGERRRSLLAVHCVQQIHLFLFFEERQLIGGVEGDFLLIHHVQQFGDQLGEADITKNLVFTLADLFSQYLARLLPKIVPNLGTIFFGRSASLSLHSFQLHLVGKSPFTGEQAFPLQIAVNHDDGGLVIVQIPHNDRHGFLARQLTGPVTPVPCHQLIAAVRVRSGNGRNQYAILPDAVGGLHHGLIVLDLEGVILERVQLGQGDFQNLFPLGVGAAFLGGKQVIYRGQLYFFRAAFQVLSPPASDFYRLPPPCRRGHVRRCSCPRR